MFKIVKLSRSANFVPFYYHDTTILFTFFPLLQWPLGKLHKVGYDNVHSLKQEAPKIINLSWPMSITFTQQCDYVNELFEMQL